MPLITFFYRIGKMTDNRQTDIDWGIGRLLKTDGDTHYIYKISLRSPAEQYEHSMISVFLFPHLASHIVKAYFSIFPALFQCPLLSIFSSSSPQHLSSTHCCLPSSLLSSPFSASLHLSFLPPLTWCYTNPFFSLLMLQYLQLAPTMEVWTRFWGEEIRVSGKGFGVQVL